MQVRPAQLAAQLAKGLAPLYVVHGDEPLLAMEAGDQIRAAARAAGFDDREVLVAETGFQWETLAAASRNLGLFGSRKLIDLRLPGGKPGADGARILEDCARRPVADAIMLITSPRLDRAVMNSTWFAALERAGVTIAVYPLERDALPAWIGKRLARQKQRASDDTLQLLADATEGNLLAAQQEVEKLALLLPEGELDPAAVEQAVADVARFDVFQLSEAWLAGDAARTCRILASLEAAGEGLPLLLWQLAEDVHGLASVLAATAAGTPVGTAVRSARVWGKRLAAMERAGERVAPTTIPRLLSRLSRLDALAKGIGVGNPWDELREVALLLAGKPLPAATMA